MTTILTCLIPKSTLLITELEELELRIRETAVGCPPTEDLFGPTSISQIFLTYHRFEEQCILICLAPEIDRKYEKLYAYLQDDITRKKPSVDLILSLLLKEYRRKTGCQDSF